MYSLWSEWDIGESNLVFATKEAGMRWLESNAAVKEIADQDKQSISECIESCFKEGLFYWNPVEIIK